MGLIATALQQTDPPKHVKDALLQRIRQESRMDHTPTFTPARQSFWSFLKLPVLAWGCAALVAVVALVLANKTQDLQHRLNTLQAEMQTQQAANAMDRRVADLLTSPQTQRVALKQPTDATKPEGRVYYQQKQGLLFYAANLPAASADHVYQLWLVPTEGAPISAGTFQTNAQGEASVILPTLPAGVTAKAFAVTLEPAGGVPQPTGPKVLLGIV
ncbi:MAG TPA: anti-sigma factor [Terriglobus sp.]